MNPFRRAKKEDLDDLSKTIERQDVIAEKHRLPTYQGSIEAAENQIPWLRDRRRRRPRRPLS